VLVFWTGASEIPPMGFPALAMTVDNQQPDDKPLSVNFCCDKYGTLLHSSTCGITIWLPVGCKMKNLYIIAHMWH